MRIISKIRTIKNLILHTFIVANSYFFDYKWYMNKHEKTWFLKTVYRKYYAALHYVIRGSKAEIKPSKIFYTNEYLILNPDVKLNNFNPLVHYELYGKYENRPISLADIKQYNVPKGSISIAKNFNNRKTINKKIVTVFAFFSGNSKLHEYQMYLLKHLNKISDYIVIVGDNTIYETELEKIENLCNTIICNRHGEYDFGSYKIGYNYLIENNILNNDDDLLFINDANYGPVYSFEHIIKHYKKQQCDFYGLSLGKNEQYKAIQSFFYIFKYNVYSSSCFINFINSVKKELSPAWVVYNYEFKLTDLLVNNGFRYSLFIPENFMNKNIIIPTKFSYTLLSKYKYPLIKRKVLQGSSAENPKKILKYIKKQNIELYNIIINNNIINHTENNEYINDLVTIHNNYKQKLEIIKNQDKINILFMVNMASMFPAESLMNLLEKDNKYRIHLYVIPDVRFSKEENFRILIDTYNELKSKYSYTKLAVSINMDTNEIIEYKNIMLDKDIVCFPSPYDVSYSIYNPYYAVLNNILSIHINYGFFRSIYDRYIYALDNYNSFWKVFLETDINYKEYKTYGRCDALNAEIVGYAKMDKLYTYLQNAKPRNKKCIIIAPHHSIDGGMNKILSLSNFEKYADFFLELPQKYPNIDFVFRPHPVLFTVLRKNNKWGEEKVNNYISKMKSYSNITYSTEGDYLEIFANSDGIIQDSGSFLVEYFYTFKPCCYMLKSHNDINEKFNKLGVKCLEHVYIAYNEENIIDFIDNVILNNNDYLIQTRNEFTNKIMVNYPQVNEKIKRYIDFINT